VNEYACTTFACCLGILGHQTGPMHIGPPTVAFLHGILIGDFLFWPKPNQSGAIPDRGPCHLVVSQRSHAEVDVAPDPWGLVNFGQKSETSVFAIGD
jgi:hypothetical protein